MILLDTCVVSEALKPQPSDAVMKWIDTIPERQVFVPSMVIGELHKGVEQLSAGRKRDALRVWIAQLRERFAGRVLLFDDETAVIWGSLSARLAFQGRTLPVIDGIIAATALRHSALLATRNMRDYENTGVELMNPWVSA